MSESDPKPKAEENTEMLEGPIEEVPEDTAAQAEEVGSTFHKVQDELNLLQDRYLRLAAEFDNYKKRSERERLTAIKFSNETILRELLPVLDHLEQAVSAAGPANESDPVVTGVKMVLKQFADTLERFGVQAFSAVGLPFDPMRHEAMMEQETAQHAPGTVVQEFQKGYMLHDRLVRAARVVIAKAPVINEIH